jgi:fatty-acyl-CoA synthase
MNTGTYTRGSSTVSAWEKSEEFCEGRLAHYKAARYVHVVEGFPMTATGKVRKVQMREPAVELLGAAAG